MSYLLDTNVILRWLQPQDSQHSIALSAIQDLTASGEVLYVTPQSLSEFWNVSTRSTERNGYGLSVQQTESLVRQIEQTFQLAADVPTIYPQWLRIVTQYEITGIQVFDARLLAVMKTYGIENILTFNVSDFQRYAASETISIVDPINVPESSK